MVGCRHAAELRLQQLQMHCSFLAIAVQLWRLHKTCVHAGYSRLLMTVPTFASSSDAFMRASSYRPEGHHRRALEKLVAVAKVRTAAKARRTSARRAVVVVMSKTTERAAVRMERATAKLAQAQDRLRQMVAAARAKSGQGRGKRPAHAKSAARAKVLVSKAQAAFAAARAATRDTRKAHRIALLQDKQRAQIAGIREKAVAANMLGQQKTDALIARLVEAFQGKVAKRLLSAEERRGRKRLKTADRKTRIALKRSGRQLARASGKRVKRKAARA